MSSAATDFNFKNTTLGKIPVKKIRENSEALRQVVDKESDKYLESLDSVKKRGIMTPILVRPIKDPVTGEDLFGLIDGLHRWNWAMDAGLDEIPAQIGELEEGNLLEAQILANVHKIETTPVQYTKALVKVLGSNPMMTKKELGDRLSRSVQWLDERLGLLKLTPEIQKLVDSGELVLTNAYALTKLPVDSQAELLSQALSQSPAEFCPKANALQKEIDKAKREGRQAQTDVFIPAERLQRLATIKEACGLAVSNPSDSTVIAAAKRAGVSTVEDAVAFTLKWTLHMDPESIEADKQKWITDKTNAKAEKEKKAKDREAEKAKKEREKMIAAGIPVTDDAAPLSAAATAAVGAPAA